MKILREVICSKCGKKQMSRLSELLESDLFWEVCEFCNQYGLKPMVRYSLSPREWMEALYNTIGFRVGQVEAFLKEVLNKGSGGT